MNGVRDHDRLIRVDMTRLAVTMAAYPAGWQHLGGRALSARVLLEECDPGCVPISPEGRLQVKTRPPLRDSLFEQGAAARAKKTW